MLAILRAAQVWGGESASVPGLRAALGLKEGAEPTTAVDDSSARPQVALAPGVTVEEAERQLIVMTLEHTRDNKTLAAEILGISLKTLHNNLNKLRLRPRKTE